MASVMGVELASELASSKQMLGAHAPCTRNVNSVIYICNIKGKGPRVFFSRRTKSHFSVITLGSAVKLACKFCLSDIPWGEHCCVEKSSCNPGSEVGGSGYGAAPVVDSKLAG